MNLIKERNSFYSAICVIVKDECLDLLHWVNYHFAIGFDKIFIFDNNSIVSVKYTVAEYIRCGIVEVQDITLNEFPQLSAYSAFLKYFGSEARWVAFIDADEYINIKSSTDIAEFLDDYVAYPAVGVSWKMFGSNGQISRPSLTPDRAYSLCLEDHSLIKSIVQPAMTEDVISPHHFIYKNEGLCVNEHGIPIVGPRSYHTSEKIQINHYYYKSQQDFENKISRGLATPMKNKLGYDLEEFYEQSRRPGRADTSIQRFSRKTDLYCKMGADYISGEILNRINVDVQQLLKDTAMLIADQKETEAIKRIRQALRYVSNPFLYVSLSKIYSMQGEYDLALKNISLAFAASGDNKSREIVFRELASVYDKMGLLNQKRHILHELTVAG